MFYKHSARWGREVLKLFMISELVNKSCLSATILSTSCNIDEESVEVLDVCSVIPKGWLSPLTLALALHRLSLFEFLLCNTLLHFKTLPLFECVAALQNPLDNLTGIDMLKRMAINLSKNTHPLRGCIWVICERDECRRAVINCVWST